MSDPVTPLKGARYDGFCQITEIGPRGMIALRGDLVALAGTLRAVAGLDMPCQRQVTAAGGNACAWMSPDEVLLMLPRPEVEGALAQLAAALQNLHHLAADVSDARALLRITGPLAREVLAKLTPADVSPAGLPVGELRRTRLAQVPAALRVISEGEVEVICFRSVAQYVFDLLSMAARPGGEVTLFRA